MAAPAKASHRELQKFAESATDWIAKSYRKLQRLEREFDLSEIGYLGEKWRIVTRDQGRTKLLAETSCKTFTVKAPCIISARKIVEQWLRLQAKRKIEHAITARAAMMGVTPARISIRDQKSRWGSCSSTGTISINWRLIMAPPEILDYIIVHELAHLQELNHSARFWKLVEENCPNFRSHERWIKQNGPLLMKRLK